MELKDKACMQHTTLTHPKHANNNDFLDFPGLFSKRDAPHILRWLRRDEPQTEWRTADLTRSFEEVPGHAMFTT